MYLAMLSGKSAIPEEHCMGVEEELEGHFYILDMCMVGILWLLQIHVHVLASESKLAFV